MTVTLSFLHHLAAFAVAAMLAIEFMLIRQTLTLDNARRLIAVDGIYGASAGILLTVGLIRVFFFEKGWYYYFTSHAFLTKFGLFIIVGLISIIPTIEFLKWRKAVKAGKTPDVGEAKLRSLRKIIHYELAGIVVILFFAAWTAKGAFI